MGQKQFAMNALLGQAELGLRETPEQRLQREAFITLLGQQGKERPTHRVSINVDPSGKETPQHKKYIWVVDDEGNRIRPIGPDTEKVQVFDQGGAGGGFEQQRNELAEIKHAEDQAYELLAVKYPGKLIKDPDTGRWVLTGEITEDIMTELSISLASAIKAKQRRGVIQDPIDIPPIGTVSAKSQPQVTQTAKKKAY